MCQELVKLLVNKIFYMTLENFLMFIIINMKTLLKVPINAMIHTHTHTHIT